MQTATTSITVEPSDFADDQGQYTMATVRATLADVVASMGRDFVYNPGGAETCLYRQMKRSEVTSDDDPRLTTACGVGRVLDALDMPKHYSWSESKQPIDDLPIPELSATVKRYLGIFQRSQDNGNSWGTAFDTAEAYADRIANGGRF